MILGFRLLLSLGDVKLKQIDYSAFFSKFLITEYNAKEAWCVDINYQHEIDATEGEGTLHFRRSIDTVNANVVLFMDVLEHVDDDIALLTSYINKVPKNAKFLISVPAFQFLWSSHDVFLEHRRRYTLREIEKIAQRAGLTVRRGAYYFAAVLPIAATLRIAEKIYCGKNKHPKSQVQQHDTLTNEILATLCSIELNILKYNRVAGLTAFCLAENS